MELADSSRREYLPSTPGGRGDGRARDRLERLEDVILAVLRHRATVVMVVLFGVATSAAMLLLSAPTYEATARLMINADVAETSVSLGDQPRARQADALEQRINNVFAMIKSRALVREVLAERSQSEYAAAEVDEPATGLAAVLRYLAVPLGYVARVVAYPATLYRRLHDVPEGDALDGSANSVLARLSVRRIEDSDIVEISFRGKDPERTAAFVNDLVSHYTRRADHVMEQDTTARFFSTQRERLTAQRREAQANILAFRQEHGGALAPDDERELRAERDKLVTNRGAMRSELAGVAARIESLQHERGTLATSHSHDSEVELSKPVETLKAHLAELEIERSELLSRFSPTSDHVADVAERIGKVKALLADERRSLSRSLAVSGDAIRELDLDLIRHRARLAELEASIAALTGEVEDYDRRIDRIEQLATEQQRLRSELAIAEDAYVSYLKKEEEARFSIALHESNISNVAVVTWAVPPSAPEAQHIEPKLAATALLSLLVGIALAFVQDRFDPTLGGASEAASIAGLPLVAVLPGDEEWWRAGLFGRARPRPAVVAVLVLLAGVGAFAPLRLSHEQGGTTTAMRPVPSPSGWHDHGAAQQAFDDGSSVDASDASSGTGHEAYVEAAFIPAPARGLRADEEQGAPPSFGAADDTATDLDDDSEPVHEVYVDEAEHASESEYVEPAYEAGQGEDVAYVYETEPVVAELPIPPVVREVRVDRGATLYSLVREQYGAYTTEILALVSAANPWLTDPGAIRVGDLLLFPELPAVPPHGVGDDVAELYDSEESGL